MSRGGLLGPPPVFLRLKEFDMCLATIGPALISPKIKKLCLRYWFGFCFGIGLIWFDLNLFDLNLFFKGRVRTGAGQSISILIATTATFYTIFEFFLIEKVFIDKLNRDLVGRITQIVTCTLHWKTWHKLLIKQNIIIHFRMNLTWCHCKPYLM